MLCQKIKDQTKIGQCKENLTKSFTEFQREKNKLLLQSCKCQHTRDLVRHQLQCHGHFVHRPCCPPPSIGLPQRYSTRYSTRSWCHRSHLLQSHQLINTHPFNGPSSGTTRVSRYQKGKTNLDFTEARDSEWQWHHLGHMQVCIYITPDR